MRIKLTDTFSLTRIMSVCKATAEICKQVGQTYNLWGVDLAFGIAETNITVHGVTFAFGEPDYKLLFGIFLNIFGVLLVIYYSFVPNSAQEKPTTKRAVPSQGENIDCFPNTV